MGRSSASPPLEPAFALCSWLFVGFVNAVLAVALSPASSGVGELARQLFQLGHYLSLGLAHWCVSAAVLRRADRLRLRIALLLGASLVVGAVVARPDLQGAAVRLADRGVLRWSLLWAMVAGFSLSVPLAAATGSLLAKVGWRAASPVLATAACVANHIVVPDGYPGLHALLVWSAATLLYSATVGLSISGTRESVRRRIALGLAPIAVASLVVPPGSGVAIELLRTPADPLATWWVKAHADIARAGDQIASPWYRDRSSLPPRPATAGGLFGDNPVFILVTIDTVRYDVLGDEYIDRFPALRALRAQSIDFTNARSPSSTTVPALASMFGGVHYSQLYWTRVGRGDYFLYQSDHVRVPALLTDAGVRNTVIGAASWISREQMSPTGGGERSILVKTRGRRWATASDVTDELLEQLASVTEEAHFYYAHYLEPHAPYDPPGVSGDAFERYLGEVALVDKEIGRLTAALSQAGLDDRVVLMVTADHGEAFGEHNTTHHSKTLYDELLRVPLLVRAPGLKAGRVDEPVSLIDVGPTILDTFGVSTPGHYMGESLVPALIGRDVELTRPIVAEARLKKTLVLPSGLKAIRDDRKGTYEVYDLTEDPGELHNLADTERGRLALAALEQFFAAHTLKRDGYDVPYRR